MKKKNKEVIITVDTRDKFPGKWALLGAIMSLIICVLCMINYTFKVISFTYSDGVSVMCALIFIALAILCTMVYFNKTDMHYERRPN